MGFQVCFGVGAVTKEPMVYTPICLLLPLLVWEHLSGIGCCWSWLQQASEHQISTQKLSRLPSESRGYYKTPLLWQEGAMRAGVEKLAIRPARLAREEQYCTYERPAPTLKSSLHTTK